MAMVLASQVKGDIRLSMSQASLAFTVGSALGPAVVGALMNGFGPVAYPWALAGSAALLTWRVLREKF
jgi:predicted MFS family arabinose efflux permease